ncbi:hypothetical protein ACROYT_G037474 [Oculina patagonica]
MRMYLGIFVFAACITFGFVHSEEAPFMCPECEAKGQNADSECDANIENKPCFKEDPVCGLSVSTRYSMYKETSRTCISRGEFYQSKQKCEQYGICAVAMCDTSGCMAEFEPFMCPECLAKGENAERECEANIENKLCRLNDPVCVSGVQHTGSETGIIRTCSTRTAYNRIKNDCEKSRECSMAMCNTSGCKADLPTSAPFMCPECIAEGQNADSECDNNIKNKLCFKEDPVCALSVSLHPVYKETSRTCVSRGEFYQSKQTCEEWGICAVVMCDTSGCMGEFEPFMCPECLAKGENAESECEANIENKLCRLNDPVCVLGVRHTGSETGIIRTCYTRATYNRIKNDCEKSGECSIAMCDTSGCKAELPTSA